MTDDWLVACSLGSRWLTGFLIFFAWDHLDYRSGTDQILFGSLQFLTALLMLAFLQSPSLKTDVLMNQHQ